MGVATPLTWIFIFVLNISLEIPTRLALERSMLCDVVLITPPDGFKRRLFVVVYIIGTWALFCILS